VFTVVVPERYAGAEAPREAPVHVTEDPPDPVTYPSLPPGTDLSGRTVLLADDDMRNLFAINSVLESVHLRVIHAQNGKEAIKLLEENPHVDLVLMDTMMPEMDGLAAIRAIRKTPRFERLPIVSLTAKAMKGDRESAIAAGATDYVAKPVDPERLVSVVHRWLVAPRPHPPSQGAATPPEQRS
jgi:CheY-like chemotaxis protein